MESNYLIILSILQALIIFALVFYFLKLKKKDNANEDIKNHPDFVKSDSDVKSLSQQLKDAKDQIGFLKTDKQEQLKLIENVNAFKDLSEKSISNYKEVVNDYREFHNSLIGDFKFQGMYNEKKLKDLLLKSGFSENENGFQMGKAEKSVNSEGETTTQIPDYIISLPNQQKVVADCKVSLINFKSYCNEKDPNIRANI